MKLCKKGLHSYQGVQCPYCARQRQKEWRANNKDYVSEQNKLYRSLHKERLIEETRIWRNENPLYYRHLQQSNPAKYREATMRRKAAKLMRTPKWLTDAQKQAITEFYSSAVRLTKQSGIEYQVDHIVPLQGKNVSGLHVPWNLQVLTKSENCRKNNKL